MTEDLRATWELPDSFSVFEWPAAWRKTFLLTAPISIPLYFAVMTVVMLFFIAVLPICFVAELVIGVWTGKAPDL